MNNADIIAQHGSRYSSVTEPPTSKRRVLLLCMEQVQKHAGLPPEFNTRVLGVKVADMAEVSKTIKSRSVDYVIISHRNASFASTLPRDIVPIYVWRGSVKSLYDNVYTLLGLPLPAKATKLGRIEPPDQPVFDEVDDSTSKPVRWSEDEEAAIQIAYDTVGAAVASELFPVFREVVPNGPSRTLQEFFEQCKKQLSDEVVLARPQSSDAPSVDDDPEVRSMLEAAEKLRATKLAARLEAERQAREQAERERREAAAQMKREAAARAEAERIEAERQEAERLAQEQAARRQAEKEAAERVLAERRAAVEQALAEQRAAEEAERLLEASLSPEERADRIARQHEIIRGWTQDPSITRNVRCPCNKTGKKFKQCCLPKFNEHEMALRVQQKRQASSQLQRVEPSKIRAAVITASEVDKLKKDSDTPAKSVEGIEIPQGFIAVPLGEAVAVLAERVQHTFDKVVSTGRGVASIFEKVDALGEKTPTKTDYVKLGEQVVAGQRLLIDGQRVLASQTGLLNKLLELVEAQGRSSNKLPARTGGSTDETQVELLGELLRVLREQNRAIIDSESAAFDDLKHEMATLKASVSAQAEVVVATLDTVAKLAENMVFVRDYVLANLPAKAS